MRLRFVRFVRMLLPVAVVLSLSGCNGEDADRLSRAGRTASHKLQDATGSARHRVTCRLQSLKGDGSEASLTQQVRNRLLHDKALADLDIEVQESEGVITLDGEVAEQAQKTRAVELAESTVGVEKVVDQLRVRQ